MSGQHAVAVEITAGRQYCKNAAENPPLPRPLYGRAGTSRRSPAGDGSPSHQGFTRSGIESVRVTKSHAKFVLVRNRDWNVVVRTSMNPNECRRLKTVEISNDPAMAAILFEVVDQLFAN